LFVYRRLAMRAKRPKTAPKTCPPKNVEPPDLRPVEGPDADAELARFAKALGHPARVLILRVLARKKACTCSLIVDELPLAQSTVSEHLRVLKHAGLIRGEIEGPRVSYCIESHALRRLRALLGSL
jgi:DNA-binding transcriptional ArsR family regulator